MGRAANATPAPTSVTAIVSSASFRHLARPCHLPSSRALKTALTPAKNCQRQPPRRRLEASRRCRPWHPYQTNLELCGFGTLRDVRAPSAVVVAALSLLLVGCGSGTHRQATQGTTSTPSGGGLPTSRSARIGSTGTVATSPRGRTSAQSVTRVVQIATSTCADRARSSVHLAPRLARLAPPLPSAQAALIEAERTYRRLLHAHRTGAAQRRLLATAHARLSAVLSVNYAIERHDRAALAVATATLSDSGERLQSQSRELRLSGCA
jgi:hypothetical protein